MTNSVNIRELALEILLEYEKNPKSFLLLRQVLEQYGYLEKRDRAFLTRLVEGTVEQRILLDYVINQYSKTPVNKQKPFIRVLMRSSVYQLLFMDGVPDSAVCNEAVKNAAKKGFHGLKGFMNGVLRTIARSKETIPYPDMNKEPVKALSVRYSMPQWIVEKWLASYPAEMVERSFSYFLEALPLCVHVNEKACTAEECVKRLEEEGVSVTRHETIPYCLYLQGVDRLAKLDSFCEGWFWVQDASSMMVCEAAGLSNNTAMVLDVCSAPGGKSLHAASVLPETCVVECRDVSDYKTELIEQNIARMGFSQMRTVVWDGTVYDEQAEGCADVVLADVPCSGLGVFGKKSDIKYNVSEEQLTELVQLQREIVTQAVRYVKSGGVFVYSTCTVNPQENEEQVGWITGQLGLKPESIEDSVGRFFKECKEDAPTMEQGYLQLLPGVHKCDGFFVAKFRKE